VRSSASGTPFSRGADESFQLLGVSPVAAVRGGANASSGVDTVVIRPAAASNRSRPDAVANSTIAPSADTAIRCSRAGRRSAIGGAGRIATLPSGAILPQPGSSAENTAPPPGTGLISRIVSRAAGRSVAGPSPKSSQRRIKFAVPDLA
jgi:hypothetical protein